MNAHAQSPSAAPIRLQRISQSHFALSRTEESLLAKYEQIIAAGLETFIEVGMALGAVREKKLYRSLFSSFEEYCQVKWDMSARRARQICSAADVVANLKDPPLLIGPKNGNNCSAPILPATESQARPLVPLPKREQRQVWKEAVAAAPDGKVTAKVVQQVIDQKALAVPDKFPPAPAPAPSPPLPVPAPAPVPTPKPETDFTPKPARRYSPFPEKRRASPKSKVQSLKSSEVQSPRASYLFRISRPTGQDPWHIKEAPGWKVVAKVNSLLEAEEWLRSHCSAPRAVEVVDSGTWQSLGFWRLSGTEPGENAKNGSSAKPTLEGFLAKGVAAFKAADAAIKAGEKVSKDQLVVKQIVAILEQLTTLQGMLDRKDSVSRTIASRVRMNLDQLDMRFREKTRKPK